MKHLPLLTLASASFMLGACSSTGKTPATPDGEMIGMANPASVYCIEKGGELDIVTDTDGNQIGLCLLPDGEIIEEWELYRRDHPQGGSGK